LSLEVVAENEGNDAVTRTKLKKAPVPVEFRGLKMRISPSRIATARVMII
jgi:hypothetical protein